MILFLCFSLFPNIVLGLEFEIKSFSPTKGAISDEVKIMVPYISDMFPKCYSTGIYATHKLSARVYFNNIEATLKRPINGEANGGGTPIYVIVPSNATNGKIKVELICNGLGNDDFYNRNGLNYSATLLSSTDFVVLLPVAQDDLSVRQQYLQQTKVDQAWNYSHGSSGVVVAVIDDGVYTGHPDLDSNMWINSGEIEGNGKDDDSNGYVDDRWGWNFISNSKDMTTLGTHGTMVAGIIGAEGNNTTGISGINWNVKLMPIIACNSNSCNSGSIINAIRYAVDNGANIINLSLGGQIFNYTDNFNATIKYAFDKNVLVVIAAGNGDVEGGIGRNLNTTKVSPVCNDGDENMVLGVGAVSESNKITSWSNFGNCVDIYAPGENIISTAVPAYSTLNGFYDTADGTSFSTPIVSGIAALIKAKYPEIKNTAIRDRIINNSDYQNGLKIINAYKAISQLFIDSEKKTNITNQVPVVVVPDNSNIINKIEIPKTNSTTSTNNNTASAKSLPDVSNLNGLLSSLGKSRNVSEEEKYDKLLKSDATVYKIEQSDEQKTAVTNFVTYGMSSGTIQLGAGERRALVRDYFETVGRGDITWSDMENLVNGKKVVARNLAKENQQVTAVLKMFKKIFGHVPVFSDSKEDLSWNTMMYRIRFPRDLEKEKVGISKFQKIFNYSPKTPLDWAAVRALGYID